MWLFEENDLVDFGKYLLSEKRESNLKQMSVEDPSILPYEERFREVHDADIANWLDSRA